jgi:hypothetical protein
LSRRLKKRLRRENEEVKKRRKKRGGEEETELWEWPRSGKVYREWSEVEVSLKTKSQKVSEKRF